MKKAHLIVFFCLLGTCLAQAQISYQVANYSKRELTSRGIRTAQYQGIHHMLGAYAEGAYATLFGPKSFHQGRGYEVGAGFLYEFQWSYFIAQTGVGFHWQGIEAKIASLQMPIMVGGQYNRFFALVGGRFNIPLYQSPNFLISDFTKNGPQEKPHFTHDCLISAELGYDFNLYGGTTEYISQLEWDRHFRLSAFFNCGVNTTKKEETYKLTNFNVGLKLSFLFCVGYKEPCVNCMKTKRTINYDKENEKQHKYNPGLFGK